MNENAIQNADYPEIDFLTVFKALWQNALLIILSALLTGAAVLVVTAFFIAPTYEATATFYVNNSSLAIGTTSYSISAGELSASSTLVNTYLRILRSRTTLEDVIEKGDLPYRFEELSKMISTEVETGTATFDVTVTSDSPSKAEHIVNTIAAVLPDRITEIVDGSNVRIIDYAIIPEHRAGPSYKKNLMMGMFVGALLASVLVIIRCIISEQNDKVIHSSDELRKLYPHVKVMALIPDMRMSAKKDYYSSYYGDRAKERDRNQSAVPAAGYKKTGAARAPICEGLSFAVREAFKRLRTNLVMSFPREDKSCHLIGITSAQSSDGKSTVAINLAYSLAELEKRVLLIDADLRRSSLHEKVGFEKTPGLNELIENEALDIASATHRYKSGSSETGFDFIPSGEAALNPSEMLNSERMANLLETLSKAYDYIVIDLPPVGAVVDAISVAQELSGMLMVVRENACPIGLFSECMHQMDYASVNILGFVLNGAREGAGKKYSYSGYSVK